MQIVGKILAALAPQPVRQPVRLNGVEAFVVENRLEETVGRRIAVEHRDDVGAERFAQLWLVLQRVGIGLPDQLGLDVGMIEPLADAVHHRRLQRVVVQDRGIDEGADLGLAADHGFGLGTDPGPHRIDLLDRRLGLGVLLRHGSPLPPSGRGLAQVGRRPPNTTYLVEFCQNINAVELISDPFKELLNDPCEPSGGDNRAGDAYAIFRRNASMALANWSLRSPATMWRAPPTST